MGTLCKQTHVHVILSPYTAVNSLQCCKAVKTNGLGVPGGYSLIVSTLHAYCMCKTFITDTQLSTIYWPWASSISCTNDLTHFVDSDRGVHVGWPSPPCDERRPEEFEIKVHNIQFSLLHCQIASHVNDLIETLMSYVVIIVCLYLSHVFLLRGGLLCKLWKAITDYREKPAWGAFMWH